LQWLETQDLGRHSRLDATLKVARILARYGLWSH
jgi:hypothetical protein